MTFLASAAIVAAVHHAMNPTRSPRELTHLKDVGCTPDSVGPLEYSRHELVSSRGAESIPQGDARQSSSSSNTVAFNSRVNSNKFAPRLGVRTPGPGAYDVSGGAADAKASPSKNVLTMQALRRSSASAFRLRLEDPVSKQVSASASLTPGPGHYDVPLCDSLNRGAEPRHSEAVHNSSTLAITGTTSDNLPSIPSPRPEVKEIMRYSGTKEDTLGPADYDPSEGSRRQRSRQVNFHQYTSERCDLSGPVLCDTARLSQRDPPIARYGVFGVSTWPSGCDTPSPFSERFPLGEHAKWGCDTPSTRLWVSQRCLRDTP